jgi:membrane-associated phospholipid phosphatase
MPTALLGLLYFLAPYIVGIDGYSSSAKLLLLGFVFAYTFVFPSLLVFWLYKRKQIKSMHLNELSDRRLPYLFSIISSGFLTVFFYQKGSQLQPSAIIIGFITLVIIFIALISLKWKISAHAAGIGGALGALFMLNLLFDETSLYMPFIISLIIAGFIMTARLRLNAHNLAQVMAGIFLGLIISIIGSIFI